MVRSELVQKISMENKNLEPEEVEKIVDLFFDSITSRLAKGGRVELRNFGAFSTRSRKARVGRNPRTGAEINIPARKTPYFKPGKEIRERLKHSD